MEGTREGARRIRIPADYEEAGPHGNQPAYSIRSACQQSWLLGTTNQGNPRWQTWRGPCYEVAVVPLRLDRLRRVALGALVALASACTSPSLPLPPPAAPIISSGLEPDTFRVASIEGAQPNALILIVNRNEDLPRNKRVSGTLADGLGSWDIVVTAKVGDVLDISQEASGARSPDTTVTVR